MSAGYSCVFASWSARVGLVCELSVSDGPKMGVFMFTENYRTGMHSLEFGV